MPDLTDLPEAKTVLGLVDRQTLAGRLLLTAPGARFTDHGPLFVGPD